MFCKFSTQESETKAVFHSDTTMRARRVARAAVLMGVGAAAATHHHNKKMHQQEKREYLWLTALSSTLSARARHHHAPVVFVVCWKKNEIVHAQLNISKTDLIYDQELGTV